MARHAESENNNDQNTSAEVEDREAQPDVQASVAEDTQAEGSTSGGRTVANTSAETNTAESDDKPDNHEVQKGDTLLSIAARYGTSPRFLQKLNELEDPNALKVGDTLKLRKQSENS